MKKERSKKVAMFSIGKKKKEGAQPPMPPQAPVDQITGMRQQGYNDNQIIQYLQGQGYTSSQVFEGLNQATPASQGFQQMQDFSSPEQEYSPEQSFAPQQASSLDQPPTSMSQSPQQSERIEEIAEAIIDEKWNEFTKEVGKIVEWKERTEGRIIKIEQELKYMKESFDLLHKSILGKISEYDKNMTDVSTGINAMERVFQKVLPTLTENVNKLSRITDNIPQKKK